MPSEVRYKLLDYYNVPYRIFGQRFSRVLILGAGAGNDVATALRNNVAHVDAIEIDPAIVDIDKRLHPERPYASERVQVHIGDARTFIRNQVNSGYDLIIFGALDSHTVFSSMSSLRLDNYVYTVESFRDSLKRLAPDGVIAVTFFYYKNGSSRNRVGGM
jgi:spermidine synthase